MAVIEWFQFVIGAILLLCGLGIFVVEMIGVFRFQYVLNRMHAAAMGDTLGIGFALLGLIVMNGWNFTSLKLFLVLLFLWFSSPASSHLIARLEVATDGKREEHYRVIELRELEAELQETAGNTDVAAESMEAAAGNTDVAAESMEAAEQAEKNKDGEEV